MSKSIRLALGLCVVAAAPARAALFTVGPAGTHRTIQAGITAAIEAPGSPHEVRIASGTFYEHVEAYTWRGSQVLVSGGWSPTFTSRTGATTLDADGSGRALRLYLADGTRMTVRYLTVRNGFLDAIPHETGNTFGAGVHATVAETSTLELSFLLIRDNRIHASIAEVSSARGAGLAVDAMGSSFVRLASNTLESNQITHGPSAPATSHGGGAWLYVAQSAKVEVKANTFLNNLATGTTYMGGGGLHLSVLAAAPASAIVEDNRFEENEVAGGGSADPTGGGLAVEANAASTKIVAYLRRNRLIGNTGQAQLYMGSRNGVGILASDTLAAGGSKHGVRAVAMPGSAVAVLNSTAVGNAGAGISMGGGTGYAYNDIAFGNGVDLDLAVTVSRGSNLAGVDPLFEPGSLYRLQAVSPARDAGTNTPPGGLGPLDVDREPRVSGTRVDVGADEWR